MRITIKVIMLLLFIDVIVFFGTGDIRCFTTTYTFKDSISAIIEELK